MPFDLDPYVLSLVPAGFCVFWLMLMRMGRKYRDDPPGLRRVLGLMVLALGVGGLFLAKGTPAQRLVISALFAGGAGLAYAAFLLTPERWYSRTRRDS